MIKWIEARVWEPEIDVNVLAYGLSCGTIIAHTKMIDDTEKQIKIWVDQCGKQVHVQFWTLLPEPPSYK